MRTPYSLTLEYGDRMAIDWIGPRYSHGNDLRDILMQCTQAEETEWSDNAPITFQFPEHLAWAASEAIDGDNLGDLVNKCEKCGNAIGERYPLCIKCDTRMSLRSYGKKVKA